MTELLAALSFGADLGLGHPTEHVLRQTYIALHLAERQAMHEQEHEVVYYTSMLAWLGCHIDAYEQATTRRSSTTPRTSTTPTPSAASPSCCGTSATAARSPSASKPGCHGTRDRLG